MSERENMNLTPEEKRMQESVRGLGEVRADDAFRAELRAKFMSGALAESSSSSEDAPAEPEKVVVMPEQRRRSRRPWALIPAIAAMWAIIFFGGSDPEWQLENIRGTGTVTINGEVVDASDVSTVAELIGPEARITVSEEVEIDLVLARVMVLGVAGDSEFTLPGNPTDEPYIYQATVHEGEFRIKTGPDFPGRQALLFTSEGRVEITGTSVAVFKGEDVTCVCVLEGTAMIGKDADHLDAVSAGMRKVMFADDRDPMIIPIEPGHRDNLIEFEEHNHDTFEE